MRKHIVVLSIAILVLLTASGCEQPISEADQMAMIQAAAKATSEVQVQLTMTELENADHAVKTAEAQQAMLDKIAEKEAELEEQKAAATSEAEQSDQKTAATQEAALVIQRPTKVSVPQATETPTVPCNQAAFIDDVTIPDGSKIGVGDTFTKTWRLKNTGSCSWNRNYQVVSVGKFHMGGPQYAYLNQTVSPGQTADITMELVAPMYTGNYESEYLLMDDRGNKFGIIGSRTRQEMSFWLRIEVVDNSTCAVISFSPSTVDRNSEFDGSFTIRNNSDYTWDKGNFDIHVIDGKYFLKYGDKELIDFPSSVDPGNDLSMVYDLVAPGDTGSYPFTVEILKDNTSFCTVYGNITVK